MQPLGSVGSCSRSRGRHGPGASRSRADRATATRCVLLKLPDRFLAPSERGWPPGCAAGRMPPPGACRRRAHAAAGGCRAVGWPYGSAGSRIRHSMAGLFRAGPCREMAAPPRGRTVPRRNPRATRWRTGARDCRLAASALGWPLSPREGQAPALATVPGIETAPVGDRGRGSAARFRRQTAGARRLCRPNSCSSCSAER